ncbi:MPN domain-containing protein [Pseudozyma hubeiensis]|nr:MPN domain-containing protein [Pseudozyma hubeiensis]
MSSISSVTVSSLAYKKLILHAAKYPTARVLGFLLADSASPQTINIVDSIPLSHHWTALAPMAEVALSLATSYASSKTLRVVGLYEAPELTSDRNPSPQANKLTEKIAGLANAEALLLLVNNATLLKAGEHSLSGFTVSSSTSGKGDTKPKALAGSAVVLQDQSRAAEVESAVRKDSAWDKIVDFDDHLEDPSLDWLQNLAITA